MPQNKVYSSPAERQRAYRERVRQQHEALLAQVNVAQRPTMPKVPGSKENKELVQTGIFCLKLARDKMESYADERSERWQESEKGEEFRERIEELDEIISQLENW